MVNKDKLLSVETAWVLADQLYRTVGIKSWLTWLMELYIRPTDTVLDLGCGDGYATKSLPCRDMVGIDVWEPVKGIYHSQFMLGNIEHARTLVNGKTFDVVLCLDALEHLEDAGGEAVLKNIDSLATELSIIFTPATFTDNSERTVDDDCWAYGNEYNVHKSLWDVPRLKAHGYDAWEPNLQPDTKRGNYVIAVKDQRVGV